ncbi:MAG: hypothetical protein J0H17_01425 [Rhizobiales bacterium]|nr:hypothetical protein [Hyphomicrobiales bacterium]
MSDSVGVMDGGDWIFVIVEDRAKFDKIAVKETDHGKTEAGHCLSKSVEQHGTRVIFQHWIEFHMPQERSAA